MKNTLMIIVSFFITLTIGGCSAKTPQEVAQKEAEDFRCKQEGELAPSWTCYKNLPEQYTYATVGSAQKSAAGTSFTRRMAIADARSNIAQQVQTLIKDKIENFTRATGYADREVVDKVNTAVSKQVAKIDLQGSKAIDSWESSKGTVFVLVGVQDSQINKKVQEAVKSSFKNDDALWQQFQSKQALENLEKEFPQ